MSKVSSFTKKFLLTSALFAVPFSASAGEAASFTDALSNGDPYIDVRYRFESVDQNGFAKDANASTLRTKLGYKTGAYKNVSATLEVENITVLGGDNYNDTVNGKTHLPTIADPASTEVNQAFLDFSGIPDTLVRVGRQIVNLDNQRFIGSVGWRQNDMTHDAAAVINSSIPDTTLLYAYVNNVNTINGDDHPFGNLDASTHLVNVAYAGIPFGKLSAYGYFLDLDEPALVTLETKTFGARFAGDHKVNDDVTVMYAAEYARQSDHADNPTNFTADYYVVEAGVGVSGFKAKLGYEVLGSDNNGTVSFQTPLATGHKFNGWADKFLATPAAGLEDLYGEISYHVADTGSVFDGTCLLVAYHDFSAETGGADYGSEWDAKIAHKFDDTYTAGIYYANYDADTFSSDTQKVAVQVGAKF